MDILTHQLLKVQAGLSIPNGVAGFQRIAAAARILGRCDELRFAPTAALPSDGRGALAKDGTSFTPMRWSTPLSAYRDFGAHRLMSHGEGVWHAEAGAFVYLRFEVVSIEYNVGD